MPDFLVARLLVRWPTVKARSHLACLPLRGNLVIASLAAAMAKHFLEPEFGAANVCEVTLDAEKLAPALALVPQIQALTDADHYLKLSGPGEVLHLSARRPKGWHSDISWWSADDPESFTWFQRMFEDLGVAEVVAPYVDYSDQIRLFVGSFVVRSRCSKEDIHVDWIEGNNDGFTMMAPLTANAADMGMAYMDYRAQRRVYSYAMGRGLVFGDLFAHSTQAGETDLPAVFLCFNFGTDKMDRWPQLSRTTGNQGRLHRRPDGIFVRDGVPLASG